MEDSDDSCCRGKTNKVESVRTKTDDRILRKKDVPYGYLEIYSGVRRPDGSYTSPLIELHIYRKEQTQKNTKNTKTSPTVPLEDTPDADDSPDLLVGPVRRTEHHSIDLNEEIRCIPIEAVISINYASEVKIEHTERTHEQLSSSQKPETTCCESFGGWCCCCCCCDDSKEEESIDPAETTKQIVDQKGERAILIIIHYIRYSDINTSTHVNALPSDAAATYFKNNFHADSVEFYLLNNTDYDQADFDLKRAQGASLCRLVTQLKAMTGNYPDTQTLGQIMARHEVQRIGNPPQETLNPSVRTEQPTYYQMVQQPVYYPMGSPTHFKIRPQQPYYPMPPQPTYYQMPPQPTYYQMAPRPAYHPMGPVPRHRY